MSHKRDIILDAIKAFCITTVVIGHCIQYGSGLDYLQKELFYNNVLFKLIYSFHMPLFMIISGYLFANSICKNWKNVLFQKIRSLIFPVFSWAFIPVIFFTIYNIHSDLSLHKVYMLYFNTAIHHLWFLWAVFFCSIIVLCVHHLFNNSLFIYILLFLISFFVTDSYNIGLYKFMYPYFVIGFLYNIGNLRNKLYHYYTKNTTFITLFIIFSILVLFFSKSAYIYTSGHCITNNNIIFQLAINIYRYIIGLIGSLLTIIGFYKFSNKKRINSIISYIGQRTIGIYIISGFINTYVLTSLTWRLNDINYLLTIIETVSIIIISLVIVEIIQHYKFFNKILLGNRS